VPPLLEIIVKSDMSHKSSKDQAFLEFRGKLTKFFTAEVTLDVDHERQG
jgi:hypothetical protein